MTAALRTEGLTIRFGGHVAVDRVTCDFDRGTLTAIVGPNGAGKTTYFNLISGQLRASAGRVLLHGHDISGLSAAARARRGIGRAFQLTNLFPNLGVEENVRLALQARACPGLNLWQVWSDLPALQVRAEQILGSVALASRRGLAAGMLAHGDQRKLEVALLMAADPDVYMFDEPTAGMSAAEVPVILELITHLKRDPAKTIVLVEHKLDVVRALADRIIVLHNGGLVADGPPEEVMLSPVVRQAYLGASAAPLVG